MKSIKHAVELRRLAVFGIVGALNTAICYALFAVLVHICACHYRAALAADYAFGLVLGYALHRISTFADRKHLRQAFGKYTITLLATFVANFVLLDEIVRWQWLDPVPAQAVAMLAVTLASYLAQKHWVFRSQGRHETGQAASDGADTQSTMHRPRRTAA